MSLPKISVIIPTYNRGRFIGPAIDSVLNQQNIRWPYEVIVVDDGSTDGTEKVLKPYGDKIIYYKIPHSGLPAVVRNFGISKARGELIAFQDSDDLWAKDKLEQQIPVFKDKKVVMSYGNAKIIKADGSPEKNSYINKGHLHKGEQFSSLLTENVIPTLTVVVRRSAIDGAGRFNESNDVRAFEDYELWLKISARNPQGIKAVHSPLASYRRHESNISIGSELLGFTGILAAYESLSKINLSQEQRSALEKQTTVIKEGLEDLKGAEFNPRQPKVSVVMSVYNSQRWLKAAITSILGQSYKNFEFIIINDGSTDDSDKIIRSFHDSRVRYYPQKNKGLANSLNRGIKLSRAGYIARMDNDDISAPTRIERQVKLLEKNKNLVLVGTNFLLIDENDRYIDHSYHLDRPEDLRLEIFTRNPFGHGTVMFRKSLLDTVGLYDEGEPVEDYKLWWQVVQEADTTNIPEELYSWRVVSTGMSHSASTKRQKPIHNLLQKIWTESKLPNVSRRQIKSGMEHYAELGEGYLEQYKYMLAALCLGAYRMKRRAYAYKLSAKLLIADPNFRRIMQDLRKNPLSHNYLLELIYKD